MSVTGGHLVRDVRFGLRALRKTPAFTLGAIATIALTVGATTAIFSVVYGVLLRQLPYRDVQQVFWLWSDRPGRDRAPFNVPDFIDYRNASRTLSGFAGFFAYGANLSDEAAAERVQGIRATGNLFDVLGAQPRLGRLLQSADERPGADHVVVLGEPFWVRRFGADPRVVGRTIRLNSELYTVVGILASGFALPIRDVEFVLPFAADQDPRRGTRSSLNFINGVGRLGEHVSMAQASGELTAIANRLRKQFPIENATKRGVRLLPVIDGIVGPFRTALVTLLAAVGSVLLIACANLANLMLTRAMGRRRELALQLALGSSRLNVVRQVLVEALMIAGAGGLLGILIAQSGVGALIALAPSQLPRSGEVRVDIVVLMFSLIVSSLTGVLFGVVPAVLSARVDVREALQGASRGATAGGRRTRGALMSAEVALAVVLLIVVTLLGKSFATVATVAPGFDPSGVLSARLTLPAKRFNTRDAIVTFQRALSQRLSTVPTITNMGAITLLPLTALVSRVPFTVEGRPVDPERVPIAQFRTVSAGYFEAVQIPVMRGRAFSDGDTERTRAVAIVNEDLASRWLQGVEPIGARLLIDDTNGPPRLVEIIGVVGNVKQIALDGEPTWDVYLPYRQIHADNVASAAGNMFWVTRTTGNPRNLSADLATAVRRIDPEVAASEIRPLEDYLSEAMAPRRYSLSLMAAFGVAALVLALTGIYAVVTYSMSQRAREIAIRLALGATRTDIMRLVMAHGLRHILVGLAIGMAMTAGAARLVSATLVGVTASDPFTFGEVAAVITVMAVVACAVPTARLDRLVVGVLRLE